MNAPMPAIGWVRLEQVLHGVNGPGGRDDCRAEPGASISFFDRSFTSRLFAESLHDECR
jgi:hypothetical protein